MPFYGGHSIRGCSAQLKLQHGKQAEFLVARQIKWASERGNPREIAYWNSVREDLEKILSHH